LRTVPVTMHLSIRDVPDSLTAALIESRGRAALRGLQRNFGIVDPRIAISGLNPHAGEGGSLGRAEIEVIEPAMAALAAEGWRPNARSCAPKPLERDSRTSPRRHRPPRAQREQVARAEFHPGPTTARPHRRNSRATGGRARLRSRPRSRRTDACVARFGSIG